jgi:hypothetical protein
MAEDIIIDLFDELNTMISTGLMILKVMQFIDFKNRWRSK